MARAKGDRSSSARDSSAEQRFLRLMSHEMRTPLNGVIGMLGLLQRTRLDGAQRAYAEAARESADHLLGLVNSLLDYARLEAGSLEFDYGPVDPEGLVRGVAELLSPRAHDKGLEIVWSVAADAPTVLADDGRLRQVLFNLAGNAVKFTETGAVRIAVERVGGTRARPRLAFVVDDTGPGVPPDARQRIFEEFGHADLTDAVRHDGAGLGLAVARKLAEAMGGSLAIEDRPIDIAPGSGARFRFEAPFDVAPKIEPRGRPLDGVAVAVRSPDPFVAQAARDQIEASGGTVSDVASVVLVDHVGGASASVAPPPSPGAMILLKPSERELIAVARASGYAGYLIKPLRRASLAERVLAVRGAAAAHVHVHREDDRVAPVRHAGMRVLLVEDNPVGALLAQTLLKREGCTVETAANGREAVEALSRAAYDLVLMDMRMPEMDGPAAATAIRARGDDTPIVALTANAFAEDRRACLDAGMDDHLVKPLETEALRAVLTRWTQGRARARLAS